MMSNVTKGAEDIGSALLVPCYNATRFLPRLREQVSRLTPQFDEVLLADDGSSDGTGNLAESLDFRILRLPSNLGPGGARNALARATAAEWIHFHDVDDELAPDYLARVHPAAASDKDVVLHFVDFVDEATREPIIRWDFLPAALIRDPQEMLLRRPMPTMSGYMRRAVFLQANGYNEELRCFEDGDLYFRLAALGARFAVVPEVLETSLRHGGGAGDDQHYCFKCRLAFLESYAKTHTRLHAAIAAEAERAATMLLRFNDKPSARRAIALAEQLGRRVPITGSYLMNVLRPVLPAWTLLHLQDRWRRLRSTY